MDRKRHDLEIVTRLIFRAQNYPSMYAWMCNWRDHDGLKAYHSHIKDLWFKPVSQLRALNIIRWLLKLVAAQVS